jgi:two-component system, LytTR family, sensor histidine kinase AgrC
LTLNEKSNDFSITKDIYETMDINAQLMFYIKENEKLALEFRNFRHSTLNMMHRILGHLELEDWDELKKYFYDIIENNNHITYTNLSSIEKIKNLPLKNLISRKFEIAVSKDINFKILVDQNISIEINVIDENDLCKVIEEFLDNAIKAALDTCIKKVSIFILTNDTSINIIIENTIEEKANTSPYKTELLTKEPNRDSGLQFVKNILSKYPNVLNNTFVQHQVFVQELQIIK